jgi:predicted AlkP superfamily pyrophosphatase or phosphodiesterase
MSRILMLCTATIECRPVTVHRWLPILAGALLAASVPPATQPVSEARHLLIIVDGLRPDYVTAGVMPNLTALGERGVVFTRHHAVYPTVTRVNASSISTGAYPERHGLLGNSVFFPRVDPARPLDTADRHSLLKIAAAEGRLLTAKTLGECLQEAGRRMVVVSSGSSGSALLNNHTVAGGAILHHEYALPEELRQDMEVIGPPPPPKGSPAALDRYGVDALLNVGLPRLNPSVAVLWLSGLDTTAHAKGMGDAATIEILRHVDGEIKRIEDHLRAAGLLDRYNIWVSSDHGFSTYTGGFDLGGLLTPFQRSLSDGTPRIVTAGGAIYVRDDDDAVVRAIVSTLQRTPGAGAIFTRESEPGSLDGRVAGTLSFAAARWGHDRSAHVLVSPDWTDAANAHGVRGTSASSGVAGHGSSSPWDIRNTLVAAGPDLKRGVTIDVPSGNVDFAPTFLTLLGLPVPSSVQGRALEEAFLDRDMLAADAVRTYEHTATAPDGAYRVTGMFSVLTAGGREHRYFDGTKVVRRAN